MLKSYCIGEQTEMNGKMARKRLTRRPFIVVENRWKCVLIIVHSKMQRLIPSLNMFVKGRKVPIFCVYFFVCFACVWFIPLYGIALLSRIRKWQILFLSDVFLLFYLFFCRTKFISLLSLKFIYESTIFSPLVMAMALFYFVVRCFFFVCAEFCFR